MKIGIFSDVHGHLTELHQTLDLFTRHQVNEVICAGDLIDKGMESDAVVAFMQQKNIICVQGNHDAKAQHGWMPRQQRLSDHTIAYLRGLPHELTFQWAGTSVYLTHSTPWYDHSVYVYPDRHPVLFKFVADAVRQGVIVLGHTHHPMRIDINGKVILNPGAICGNRNRPQRTAAILTLPGLQFDLYDIDTGLTLPL